jgi:hypothetical protein
MARFTRPTKTLMAVVLLSLAAIWATLNSPTIFFDQQIILGSSLGVFALLQFGWLGLPVGMASAFCTVAMWGHPWAALVMLLQLLWQQFFLSRFNGGTGERGNGRIVLATIIFWLLVGLPLKILLYTGLLQVDLQSATALGIKETVVAVVNSSLGLLLFLAYQLLQLRRRPGDLSLRGLVFATLLLLISLPGVLNIVLTGDQVSARTIAQFRLDLNKQALDVAFQLPSSSADRQVNDELRQRQPGLAFELEAADGQQVNSDPVLFRRLAQAYRPELDNVLAPRGSHCWCRRLLRPGCSALCAATGAINSVVQTAGEQIRQLIANMRPSLQILAVLLIAAALISELLTTVVAAQLERIVGPLDPKKAALDLDELITQPVVMPELQPTRLRELNRIVALINQQGQIVNQLSAELQHRATTDELTGLLNRRALLGTVVLRSGSVQGDQ